MQQWSRFELNQHINDWERMVCAATSALGLKHQAISSHSVEKIAIVSDQLHTKILHFLWKSFGKYNHVLMKYTQLFKG